MRKKITGEEAAIALLKGEKIFYGYNAWRLLGGHQLAKLTHGAVDYWFGLAGRNISEVLSWTDCELDVPDEPVKPAAQTQFTCPVCGAAIAEWKRDWTNGVRVIVIDRGASTERVDPDDLTITAHCDSCGANIVTRAEYFPKPDRPKLPKELKWRDI